jgi:hypothetical protein
MSLGVESLPSPRFLTVQINVPLCDVRPDGPGVVEHIEARLERQQAVVLRRIFVALDASGIRLRNGRRVITTADAVRWLLEQIPAELEASNG